MKRLVAAAVAALFVASCGTSTLTSDPTPRPEGERGRLLDPIDRARDTADQVESRQDSYYGEQEYPGGPDP